MACLYWRDAHVCRTLLIECMTAATPATGNLVIKRQKQHTYTLMRHCLSASAAVSHRRHIMRILNPTVAIDIALEDCRENESGCAHITGLAMTNRSRRRASM